LVAGCHTRVLGRQFAFDDVKVGAADAAGADSQKNVSGL